MSEKIENEIKTAISTGGIVIKDNKILLIKVQNDSNKNLWMLPGGYVEPGESIENAVIREIEEESGIKATITELIGIRTGIRLWKGYEQTNLYIVFKMKYVNGIETADNLETTEAQFFTINEIIYMDNIVGLSKELILKNSLSFTKKEISFQVNNKYKDYNLYC